MSLAEDEYSKSVQWALSKGIRINGITPAKLPGRGLGMVATRTIRESEDLITIPRALMLNIDSVPRSFIELFPNEMPIHGILAAFLTHGDPQLLKKWDPWRRTWPSLQSFKECMPMLWAEANSALLPPAATGSWNAYSGNPLVVDHDYEATYQNILPEQRKRVQTAWERVLTVFPNTDWDTFAYNWLIINTRSFYYVSADREVPPEWNDAVGLVPIADYFNHAENESCMAMYDDNGYIFRALRPIEKGEEVLISYGSHPNDFLLAEYGFFLDSNPSDAIFLDDIILGELTVADQAELRRHNLYGDYQVTVNGACSRTKMVACMKYMDCRRWRRYLANPSHGGTNSKQAASTINRWVGSYLKETMAVVQMLDNMLKAKQSPSCEAAQLLTVLKRWNQIKDLCKAALDINEHP